jgi:hypothetical protein
VYRKAAVKHRRRLVGAILAIALVAGGAIGLLWPVLGGSSSHYLRTVSPPDTRTTSLPPTTASPTTSLDTVATPRHPDVSRSANGTGPLADGVYFGYLHAVDAISMTASFEVARWWSGPTAVAQAIKDGRIQAGQPLPNDYFITRDGQVLRTLRVAANVTVTVARCPASCGTYAGTLLGLAGAFTHANPQANYSDAYRTDHPYWLAITNGQIVRIDEQYQP